MKMSKCGFSEKLNNADLRKRNIDTSLKREGILALQQRPSNRDKITVDGLFGEPLMNS